MSIKKSTLEGLKWVSIGQFIKYPLQIVVSIYLARLILPESYGLVGMVMVFVGLAALFIDLGLGSAIIQRKEISLEQLNTIFWISLGIGILATVGFYLLADYLAFYYSQPKLSMIAKLLSVIFVISSATVIQNALLTKEMQFRKLVSRDVVAIIVSSALAIYLAKLDFQEYAIIYQQLAYNATSCVLIWTVSSWRPRFQFSLSGMREIIKYSKNLTGFTFINYLIRNSDNFLIGKFMSASSLGLYSKGYYFVRLPINQFSSVITKVLFPALSKIQDEDEKFRKIYIELCEAIAFFSFPLMLCLYALADLFVLFFLGDKWLEIILILKIFSLLGFVQSVSSTVGLIYNSKGRTDLLFRWGLFAGTLLVASIGLGVYSGKIENVAIYYSLMSGVILLVPNFYIPFKLIKLDIVVFFKRLLPYLFSSSVILTAILVYRRFFMIYSISELICLLLFCIFLYIGVHELLRTSVYVLIKDKFLDFLKSPKLRK